MSNFLSAYSKIVLCPFSLKGFRRHFHEMLFRFLATFVLGHFMFLYWCTLCFLGSLILLYRSILSVCWSDSAIWVIWYLRTCPFVLSYFNTWDICWPTVFILQYLGTWSIPSPAVWIFSPQLPGVKERLPVDIGNLRR